MPLKIDVVSMNCKCSKQFSAVHFCSHSYHYLTLLTAEAESMQWKVVLGTCGGCIPWKLWSILFE